MIFKNKSWELQGKRKNNHYSLKLSQIYFILKIYWYTWQRTADQLERLSGNVTEDGASTWVKQRVIDNKKDSEELQR